MDKKTAQLQAAPGAAHTELAGAASARRRCDDVDHVDDGCGGGDDGVDSLHYYVAYSYDDDDGAGL